MNLPYFLHRSLLKMSTKARTRPELLAHDICHHGLIKILYTYELNKRVEQLRQRNMRNIVPRRQKRVETKNFVKTLAQETGDEEIETEPKVYCRKPHTNPTSKLTLSLKAKIDPKLKETVIVDEEEEIVKVSKSKKKATKQKKTEYVGRKGKETLKASRTIQKGNIRMTRSQDKLNLLAQVAEAMEE